MKKMSRETVFIFVCLLAALTACKKDLSEVKLMMEGDPVIEIDDYVSVGSEWTLQAGGVKLPVDDIGYYWTIDGLVDDNDTTDVFSFRFPDTSGIYKITCTAFHPEYYNNPTTKSVTVLDTAYNASLKLGGIDIAGIFKDERDGREYRFVSIGGLDCFISNLAYRGYGKPYKGSDVMWSMMGGYYTYEEVLSGDICPQGWRVPSENDWDVLAGTYAEAMDGRVFLGAAPHLMAPATLNDEKLWSYSPDNEPVNDSGFSALPTGYFSNDAFVGFNEYAVFWSADPSGEKGIYHYIYYDEPDLRTAAISGDFRASVRCVRDRN